MSAKHRDDSEFGSDSFLDVLANLVGILIILIVAVGIRIAKTPAEELLGKDAVPASIPVAELPPMPPAEPRELPPLPEFAPIPQIRPTADMLRQAELLKQNSDAMQSQLSSLNAEEQRLLNVRRDQELTLASLRQKVSGKAESLQMERQQISALESDVDSLRQQVQTLRRQADEINLDEAPVDKLTHHLPPVGKVVAGDEVHFRMQGNRVTFVPIAELAREIQFEIQRRKEILMNRSFYQGSTRPIDGYIMDYVLQRESRGRTDDINYGSGMIRIMVSSWIIKPVGPFDAETAEEAARPGSSFQTALSRYGPTATVTFWVYPDSFDVHQKLKEFTHDAGYWVASRPLPTGVPIAGSPQGSRSVAQ